MGACQHQPVSFNSRPVWDAHRCAKLFKQQFMSHSPTTSKPGHSTDCKLHKLQRKKVEIISLQITTSIKATKVSKALSPDGIAPIHLKHFRPWGIHYLTIVINLFMSSSIIPELWKVSRIMPLLNQENRLEILEAFVQFLSYHQ